ncbi:MAG: hypothetical protein ABIG55_00785 [Candidatus Omnitrophota bacterium]|nr:hypothetical protein [Candidatus Omnitrophota bacterium]
MKNLIRISTITAIAALVLSTAINAEAEKKSLKKASVDAVKATINYPANLVNETVNVVGKTAKGTADMVIDTTKATGEAVFVDGKKAPEIVTTPINKGAETVKDTLTGTVEAPVKAGKATLEQNK